MQRQGRHERHLLPRRLAVVHRRRAAPAPGGDQPVGGRERRLPRPGDARRHARHRLRPAAAGRQLLRQEPEGGHPRRGRALPADERAVGEQDPDFDQITVPAYVVASYSNTLHTAGTFRAWRRMASEREVAAHPQQPGVARLLRRGERRGPAPLLRPLPQGRGQRLGDRRRACATRVLDLEGGDQVDVAADQFPPADVTSTKFYLDGRTPRADAPTRPPTRCRPVYDVAANPNAVSFLTTLRRGDGAGRLPEGAPLGRGARRRRHGPVRADPEARRATARRCRQFTAPNQSAMVHDLTDHGATILRYKGSDGRLRVSAAPPRRDPVDRRRARPQLRPGREARARRDRRDRDRPAARSAWRSTRASSCASSSAPATCSAR